MTKNHTLSIFAVALAVSLPAVSCSPASDDTSVSDTVGSTAEENDNATAPEPISIVRADAEIERTEKQDDIPVDTTILFTGSAVDLSDAAIQTLKKLVKQPSFRGIGQIHISGHTDSSGTDSANLKVSRQRAEAVAEWLIASGVNAERIKVIALGEQNPAQPNALPDGTPNEEGREANRRVEITASILKRAAEPEPQVETPSLIEQVATEN